MKLLEIKSIEAAKYSEGDVVSVHQHKMGTDLGSYGKFNISKVTPTQIHVYDDNTKETMKFNSKTLRGIGAHDALMLKEAKIVLPKTKPRDPTQNILASKKNAGGPMKKPREGVPRDEKHKKPADDVREAAAPFEKFSRGDKAKVKKTGEEVTVVSQNDIGLVFTSAADAKARFFKGGSAQAKGYKEYMPRELERVK